MKFLQWNYGVMLMVLITCACVEPYDPPVDDTDVNYLVVDGFINASDGVVTVTLTRTLPVASTGMVPSESGAFVALEDAQGLQYPLSETKNGIYRGLALNVSFDNPYRLFIRTNDNDEYASDYITLKETPVIDSIHYSIETDGIQLAVNTHDITGKSRHYRWKYWETYEYNSRYNSTYMFDDDEVVIRPNEQSIRTCWKTNLSTNIIVGSTERLRESVVSNFPIMFIPQGSIKLSRIYSLLVQQQTLSNEGYDYWLNLQKSTENLGGLFDPLPSEVSGNIYCTTKPDETVIGFFSGSSVQEARIFLRPGDLPKEMSSYNNPSCVLDSILLQDIGNVSRGTLLVDGIYLMGPSVVGYTTSMRECIDCTYLGGTTTRPDFWE